ncbi:SpoIIE family protein phosphatase [Sphaerimonospora mesophila]|uniref:SpoIIE family protein phosphatase n=1 Tax=Sphaerimonospora mesophila TaxID=37483 RepID=UPI0006E40540
MGVARGEETSGLPLEVFDPSPVGVLVTEGKEHRLVYLNDALRAMFGDRPLGTPVREAFSNLLQQDSLSLFDRVLETGEAVRRDQATARVACPSGGSQERFFHYSLSKIPLPGGKSGVLQVIVEVTEQFVATRRMRTLAREQRRLLRRYQSLIWVNAHTVWVSDPSGRFREVSPDWKKMTGQTREEYRGYGWLQVVHPEDRASIMDAWLRAAEEVPPLIEQVFRVRVLDGTYRHFRLRAVPVCKDGAVVEWVGASTEIEQEWQENRCRKLLDRAAAAVADITDLEEMFQALADVIVPELADACHIHLLPELADSFSDVFVTERIATAVRAGLPRMLRRQKAHHPSDSEFMRAVRERRPVYLSFPPGEPPPYYDAKARVWITEARAHSQTIIPVVVQGEVAAVVVAAVCGDRPSIDPADVELMGQILDHTHDALGMALRFRRTQRVALALQHSLLAEPPHVPGMEIAARYQASPAAAEIGGDWYDAFTLPGGAVEVAIGDVAGHDLAAAVWMSQVRNMVRALAVDRDEPPGDILHRLDTALETLNGETTTVTCVLGRLEAAGDGAWRLTYAVAGHLPPLLVTHDGDSRFLREADNPLLGLVFHDRPWISAVVPLPPASTLLLYTDGLVEQRGEDLDRGLDRLRRYAESLAGEPLNGFCDGLLTSMPMTGEDDVALIALRVPPIG